MCLAASVNRETKCNIAGSITRVLVLKSADLDETTFTRGTSGDRFKVTAVTGSPDVFEIPFNTKRPASGNNVKNGNAYTQTISFRITSNKANIFRDLNDFKNCCGYVAFVKDTNGAWFAAGLLDEEDLGLFGIGELEPITSDYNTAEEANSTDVGFSVVLESTRMNSTWIPVAPAAITTLESLIVAPAA